MNFRVPFWPLHHNNNADKRCGSSRLRGLTPLTSDMRSLVARGGDLQQQLDALHPRPTLTGTWRKDKQLSDDMTEACDLVELNWVLRRALFLLNTLEVRAGPATASGAGGAGSSAAPPARRRAGPDLPSCSSGGHAPLPPPPPPADPIESSWKIRMSSSGQTSRRAASWTSSRSEQRPAVAPADSGASQSAAAATGAACMMVHVPETQSPCPCRLRRLQVPLDGRGGGAPAARQAARPALCARGAQWPGAAHRVHVGRAARRRLHRHVFAVGGWRHSDAVDRDGHPGHRQEHQVQVRAPQVHGRARDTCTHGRRSRSRRPWMTRGGQLAR